MDLIRLRTLTDKSVLGFGQYRDMTLRQIIDYGKTNYLGWVYFNCETIDFHIDLLNEIYINHKYRLTKPAKAPELYEKWIRSRLGSVLHTDPLKYNKSRSITKHETKMKMKRLAKTHSFLNKKCVLQAKNHGKR